MKKPIIPTAFNSHLVIMKENSLRIKADIDCRTKLK